MPPPPPPTTQAPFTPDMSDSDLSAIRSRYLGVTAKKRKIRKMNDRKFVFDWDEQEDTFSSESPSAVGANRQGAVIMFGRGHMGGMEDDNTGSGSGSKSSTNHQNSTKGIVDGRHWTQKPLNDMKDRDWRIFREDFSISTKGRLLLSLACHSFLTSTRWQHPESSPLLDRVRDTSRDSFCG